MKRLNPVSHPVPDRPKRGFAYSRVKIHLARLLELLAAPLVWIIPTSSPADEIRKIVILEPFVLGDAALLAVMLAPLKARFPEAQIHLMLQPISLDLFKHDLRVTRTHGFLFPWAQRVRKYRFWSWKWRALFRFIRAMRLERFDVGIDCRGEVRSQILMVLFACPRRVGFTNYLIHIRGMLLTDSLGVVRLQHRTQINLAKTYPVGWRVWPHVLLRMPRSIVGYALRRKFAPLAHLAGLAPALLLRHWEKYCASRPHQPPIVRRVLD